MPDFGEMPNLEELNLKDCIKLVQIDPSIGVLRKLVFLKLKDCKNLVSIPNNILGLSSLKYLNFSGCSKVFNNPRHLKKLDSLYHEVLTSCLLPSLLSIYCLNEVDISFCGLSYLPDAIGCLLRLERLNIGGNNFVTLPSLRELSKLVYLNLEHCKLLESFPQLPFPTAFEHMTTYKRTVGLFIFNCPKLGESEHCNSMAFSWMTQLIQARQQPSTFSYEDIIKIVVPGSEIPIWFNNQSEGSSIRMELSQIMDDNDNDFIGIACCAVFSVAPVDPTMTTYAWRPKIEIRFSNSNSHLFSFVIIPVILDRDHIVVKSNHMCLMYFPLKSLFDILKWIDGTLTHLDDINMKASIMKGQGLDLEVQNCGYRWVYKQDLQPSNLTMMHLGNRLARKRKFLAIVDEAQTQSLI